MVVEILKSRYFLCSSMFLCVYFAERVITTFKLKLGSCGGGVHRDRQTEWILNFFSPEETTDANLHSCLVGHRVVGGQSN